MARCCAASLSMGLLGSLSALTGVASFRATALDNVTGDGDESLCCCSGPRESNCLSLFGEDLAKSKSPFSYNAPMCPYDVGYHDYRDFGWTDPPSRCGTHTSQSVATGKNVTLRVYWMRHGWSCANAMKAMGSAVTNGTFWQRSQAQALSLTFASYGDPGLTDVAIARAQELGKPIRQKILEETGGKVPLAFSSAMVRAMETSVWNFPEWPVRPIPYIAETGMTPDNIPWSWHDQEGKLRREPTTHQHLNMIEWDVNDPAHRDRATVATKSDYSLFTSYFPRILNELYESGKAERGDADSEIPIVITSHSGYMKEHLECTAPGNGKPRNNEVWIQKYTVQLGAWNATLKPAGCTKLLDRDYFPEAPSVLCDLGVERCGKKPTYWIEQDAETCTHDGFGTDQVARDRAHGERYAQAADL